MKLIVGLGNPGKKYEKTRHNIGFMAVNALQKKMEKNNISKWEISKKFNAEICGYTFDGEKIILAKPLTFMNDSGQAVHILMHYYNILPQDLTIIHDDKDVPIGQFKIQNNRGSAGHNGVISVIQNIGSQNFTRIRIGIKNDNEKKMMDIPKFVLSNFGILEKKTIKLIIEKVIDIIEDQIK